jgi:YihY family inner membrane protein
MNVFEKPLAAADRFQQRWPVLAFPVAVWSKFNDDRAGNLAALIAYYAFAALFPLLLILVTVLNIVLANDPKLQATLLTSALAQYPVIGPYIQHSLGAIPGTGLPLAIGIVLLLLGARGVAAAMQNALCEVWDIPREDRPGFFLSQVWAMALILTIGIGFVATAFLSGLAGGAGHVLSGAGAHIGTVVISLVLNVGVFWLGFRLATLFKVPWRSLRTGAGLAAVCWQVLLVAGGYVVSHQLHRASELYGTFGVVLGLLAWLFLQAELTLYAAEADVVLARGLWPRSILPDEQSSTEGTTEVSRGKHARPEVPPSLEGQPSRNGQADTDERTSVPSPRAEPQPATSEPPASDEKAGSAT